MEELFFWIIAIIASLFFWWILSSIETNTRETKRFTQMSTVLLKKLLEKQGETIDLKELYTKAKNQQAL